MISFPNAKINLGLNILSKRPDGYHNLSSCFYPINWKDILEIIPAKKLKFTSSGVKIPGNITDNLCLKAYNLLYEDFQIPPVHIHLHKIIPIGAGLGGGSSDASFTLKMLSEIFNLSLSIGQLEKYASQLGSDCPFFINNKPTLVSGTGNQFKTTTLNLSGKFIVLIYPEIHISTKEAYSGITPSIPEQSINHILNGAIDNWQFQLKNDFENSVIAHYPEIISIKEKLLDNGAIYSSMTGSGSAVFGIFKKNIDSSLLNNLVTSYTTWSGIL